MDNMLVTMEESTRNEALTITNASQVISNSRPDRSRKAITIRNIADDATKIITVNFGAQQATANAGIVLRQYESVSDSSETGYECFQGTITAVCAVASVTADLTIFER